MEKLFYRPKDGFTADVIPFWHNGEFRLFYLKDYRDKQGKGEGTPWFQIATEDFVYFAELGEAIPRGNAEEQDLYVFTGCVIEAENLFHIFYTGHNPSFIAKGKPQEAIMHAVSDDLLSWRKIPEDTFYADGEKYERHDFRDPFVFCDPESGAYRMLLVSRKKEGGYTSGFTASYSSRDLKSWAEEPPFWSPNLYHTHECPDLFQMGKWWYMIFSEYSDTCVTRYIMSESLSGPWIMPEDDAFDGRAFYAAKSFSDGQRRYLFGWIPTKERSEDNGGWMWGGNLAVHELVQRGDGTLACKLPEPIEKAWTVKARLEGPIALSAPCGKDERRAFSALPPTYKVSGRLRFGKNTKQFGISFGQSFADKRGYKYEFFPGKRVLKFNSITSVINAKDVTRPIGVDSGAAIDFTLIVDGEVCVLYVNNEIALSARMYDICGSDLSFFAVSGQADAEDVTLSVM